MFAALIGSRHIVTFMLFLGMANAYVMRTNMSVAIVAMVNHTATAGSHHDPHNSAADECGIGNDTEAPEFDPVSTPFLLIKFSDHYFFYLFHFSQRLFVYISSILFFYFLILQLFLLVIQFFS